MIPQHQQHAASGGDGGPEGDGPCSPRERAAILVEYAFLILLIAAVALAAVALLGNNTSVRMSSVAEAVNAS